MCILRNAFNFIILSYSFSCNSKENEVKNCSYTVADLYRDYDSLSFEKVKFERKGNTDFLDKGSMGKRSIYTFDNNNVLRFYAFLISDSNEYNFSIRYDSLGNEIKRIGPEVVHWFFRKLGKDTVSVTFFLNAINHVYNGLRIEYGTKKYNDIQLQKSEVFSNIIGSTIDIVMPKSSLIDTVYIYGLKKDACSGKEIDFKDFVLIPSEEL